MKEKSNIKRSLSKWLFGLESLGHREFIKITGKVEMWLYGPDGKLKQHDVHENLIVDIGFAHVRDLILGSGNAIDYIGIGWNEPDSVPADPAADDVNFGSTKQNRVQDGSPTIIDEKNWKLSVTYGSGEPSNAGSFPVPIRLVGSFWASGSGDNEMFSKLKRDVVNKASVDTIIVEYTFTMS